jgi:hypothetical protein
MIPLTGIFAELSIKRNGLPVLTVYRKNMPGARKKSGNDRGYRVKK